MERFALSQFARSVLMSARTGIYGASLCVVSVSFILASLTITSPVTTMPTMSAVTEEVHGDEEYKNQNPEPICQQPIHLMFRLSDNSQEPLWPCSPSRLLGNT